MQREMIGARAAHGVALLSIAMCVLGCSQSASARAEDASARASSHAAVRASETVERVTIPKDSGRVLYDAPTDLSFANAIRTKAHITGIDSTARPHP